MNRVPLHERQARYEIARDFYGLTVEEWEDEQGYPPFSVYPHARVAWMPAHVGFLMYSRERHAEALAEEERQMLCLIHLGVSNRDVATIFEWPYFRVWSRFNKEAPKPTPITDEEWIAKRVREEVEKERERDRRRRARGWKRTSIRRDLPGLTP